jgi:hypothetical protein
MPLRLSSVTFEAREPLHVARFWADLLGRDVFDGPHGAALPGNDVQVSLGFAPCLGEKVGPNRMHLHLASGSHDEQQETVARALALGARHLDVGQRPEEGHIVLADPGENEFCVIEPGNSFLAGCGFLAEVACDGTRAVGRFWSEALEWPLVWDQAEETAIQSPHGGTKIAWGGPPVAPLVPGPRQRFDLAAVGSDLEAEADRLVGLGAVRLESPEDGMMALADPDGPEFRLVAGEG